MIISPYNANTFKETFTQTDLYKRLAEDFDLITWNIDHVPGRFPGMTPREYRGIRVFSAVPFYYILQLDSSSKIYDIGCGWNIYKKYLPNVIGISGEPPDHPYYHGDEYGWFDDDYVSKNANRFDNVISMNSLHFIPLDQLQHRIKQILSVTKPGGRIFLMMNIYHMINHQDSTVVDNHAQYIRDQFKIFDKELLCFELDDDYIDQIMSEGTLRVLLQK